MSNSIKLLVPVVCTLILALAASAEVLVSENLGTAAYTGSGTYHRYTPDRAFDGKLRNNFSYWNGGAWPVGWIEVDLQQTQPVSRIKLVVAQLPNGPTEHQVWLSDVPLEDDPAPGRLVHVFAGVTRDQDTLELALPDPMAARYVQIRTVQSPSWVAWMEVQVFAEIPF